jgi:hypothetical protein
VDHLDSTFCSWIGAQLVEDRAILVTDKELEAFLRTIWWRTFPVLASISTYTPELAFRRCDHPKSPHSTRNTSSGCFSRVCACPHWPLLLLPPGGCKRVLLAHVLCQACVHSLWRHCCMWPSVCISSIRPLECRRGLTDGHQCR